MSTKEKLTYYNGIMWRTVISEGRARVSQPRRWDGTRRWDGNGAVPTPRVTGRRMSGPAG